MNREDTKDLANDIIVTLSDEIDRESYTGWYNIENAVELVQDCIEQFLKREGLHE